MPEEDEGLEIERRRRRERNAAREALQAYTWFLERASKHDPSVVAEELKRSNYLADLQSWELSEVLHAEQEAREEIRERLYADAGAREQQRQAEWREQVTQYRADAQQNVLQVWQDVRQHELGLEQRKEFLARTEVTELAGFSEADLVIAARRSMDADDGELLLAHWLDQARIREENAVARESRPQWRRHWPVSWG